MEPDASVSQESLGILLATVLLGACILFLYIRKLLGSASKTDESQGDQQSAAQGKDPVTYGQADSQKSKKRLEKSSRETKSTFSHSWLFTSLKGHIGRVLDLDFSPNGKWIATCADDRSVLIWTCKDLDQKDHKSIRANVEYDHAVKVKWSPDSKAFIVFKAQEGVVEVYKVSKKPDSKLGDFQVALTFPKKHEGDCVGLGIACDGKYIMTCSNRNDLVIWDLKGEVLAQQDTHQVDTYSALISPCGRFVATSGFTPDVKVWEVKFTRTGEFSGLVRAFELKGHNSGVYSFGFNTDSTKAATVSKDGTWKLYDTNIEYEKGQEPHLISTNKYESQPGEKTLLALSPDGRTVAITSGNDLLLFSAISGNLEKRISNIHTGGIMAVMFDPSNKLVLTAGDRQVRMFHNVVGYKATIEELEGKRKTATTVAMRERIIQQISEAKAFLQSLQ